MPKKVATLNDFSGGLNNATDERDLAPNEFSICSNLDPHKRGKLIVTGKFLPETAPAFPDRNDAIAGYGMFFWETDYKVLDGTAGYTGYNILQMNPNGGGAEDGTLDMYATDPGTWGLIMAGLPGDTPAFMVGDGDLFVSGNHTARPGSFIHVKRSDFNLSDGTHSNITRELSLWITTANTTKYYLPDADSQQLWWASIDSGGIGGGGSTVVLDVTTMTDASEDGIATNELIWVIEWSGDDNSGSWSNAGDVSEGRHIQFASSWLYKNLAESDLYVFTTPDYVGTDLDDNTGHYEHAIDRALKVHACIDAVTTGASTLTNRSGSRLYARMSDENEWYLLAEVDYEKGIIGDAETEFTAWANGGFSAQISASTGFIKNPPAIFSYFANNGYSPSDIPNIGTSGDSADRKVFWKTGVVANGRAYVGNVKINDRIYGDRIFKSPPFQYDIFTENQWLENTTNDGDEIIALKTYADRILMFKKQSVTVINISQVDEYVESEQKNAGIEWPAAVVETEFGIAWVNETGCFLYNGENISNLLFKQAEGGKSQKIDSIVWNTAINNPVVGFSAEFKQLIIVHDGSSPDDAFIYSFNAQSWHLGTDTITPNAISNMIGIRGGNLLVTGGASATDISSFKAPTDAGSYSVAATLETGELSFGNYELKKTLNKIVITWASGAGTLLEAYLSIDGADYGSLIGTVATAVPGRHVDTIDLTGNALYQGKKTFQLKLTGTVYDSFELEDISFIFRELIVS